MKVYFEMNCFGSCCQVCGLDSTFRMSTMTHLGSFVTDEVIGDAMPMSIKVFNSKIELMVREDFIQFMLNLKTEKMV